MEKKICKKCGKELPELLDNSNDKLCVECLEKRKSIIRKILIGVGAVGAVAATAVFAGLASKNKKDGDDFDFEYDDYDEEYDESLANQGRAIDMMNGDEDYDDDFVQMWL